ncbi:MAG TPA: phosphatidate cytidylyltransferase [Geobacteraceae bacterium]
MQTAAVALPLLILLILKGGVFLFTGFVLLLSFLGLTEFYRMALPEGKREGLAASLAGALLPLAFLYSDKVPFQFALTLLVLLSCLHFLFTIRDIRQSAGEAALFLMGFLYVPLLLGHLVLLRGLPHGVQWVFLLIVIVMAGDTGAYYTGSSFGRRKLYPIVSPNKSMEGAAGGLAGSVVGALIAKFTFFPELTVPDAVMTALLLGVLGQLGDLFESLLKRSFGVKDSGSIIPGHGGILDRLDSILFAAPAAFYYAMFIFMRR